MHGIHVHAVAKCEGPAFTSAGGHLNPDMKHHGLENPEGPHAGDMPNITVGRERDVEGDRLSRPASPWAMTLIRSSANGGTALVIHAHA